jgi:NADPH:quinone reductase-like Zn-dependent oxidoreductase
MKYVSHEDRLGPDSITIKSCSVPEYDPTNEVLIKVEATAANRADLL